MKFKLTKRTKEEKEILENQLLEEFNQNDPREILNKKLEDELKKIYEDRKKMLEEKILTDVNKKIKEENDQRANYRLTALGILVALTGIIVTILITK